jgi:hypothetical protein
MLPILLALAFIAILLIIVIAGQPEEFKVCRSIKISASPKTIFPHINDLHQWDAWSPWAKLDLNAKNFFDGPPFGIGASFKWEGNNKVGVGRMTIAESQPDEAIRLRLDFEKPMKATNMAEFTFRPEAGQTIVTWSMLGKNNFMGRIFGLLMNCDRMVGGQFEQGLANLKSVVETTSRG